MLRNKLFLSTTDNATLNMIDVSKWNGDIDWQQVKNSGQVDCVMARTVSSNKNGKYKDATFEQNYQGCKSVGLPIGAYFISYATTFEQFDGELDLCLEALNGKELDMPLAMDIETEASKNVGKDKLTQWIIQEAQKIEDKGFYPMLYSGLYFSRDYIDMELIHNNNLDFWLAAYLQNEPEDEHTIWQYTSKGQIAGINHDVDLNHVYVDYPALLKRNRLITACKQFWTGILGGNV